MTFADVIATVDDAVRVEVPWGDLRWLVSASSMPGALQTLGVARIDPGQANPLHAHPNCEELLYVVSGRCVHRIGEHEFELHPGMVIRIPPGVPHNARWTGDEPLVAVVSFSSGDRETVTF